MSKRQAKQVLLMQKKQRQTVQEDEYLQEVQKPQKTNLFNAFQSEQEQQTVEQKPVQKQVVVETTQLKKKNKKNKKKQVKNQQEDIEKLIQETLGKPQVQQQQTKEQETECQLFSLSQNRFKYQNELKKYFKDTKEQVVEQNMEGMNKREKKYKKIMASQKMKKSILAPGIKEYFPIVQKFHVDTTNKKITFNPGKRYETLQQQYQVIKNSNDVQEMFDFVQKNPYHVDALYNIGQFFRLKGNYKQADALIQRIIYIYQYSAVYEIGLLIKQDKPRSEFVYQRFSTSLFMAIFKFIDILGKKGCYKAALQYNKLLLKLNFNDPTACMLCLDYNACSAKQYEYMLEFVTNYTSYYGNKNQTVYWLPNMIYSTALARFNQLADYTQNKELVVEQINIDELINFEPKHFQQAIDLIKLDSLKITSPQTLLLRAILLYPKVIKQLCNKNQYSKQQIFHPKLSGTQKKPFKQIISNQFYDKCPEGYFYVFLSLETDADSQGLNKVIDAYIERSKILWKTNKVMIWVKAALGFLLDQLALPDFFNYNKFAERLCIQDEKNKKIKKIPFNLRRYQGVVKANFSDHVQRIDLNNIQDNQVQQPRPQPQGRQLNMQSNGLSLFLNSLLPWVNLPQQAQQEDPDMPIIEEDHEL